MNLNVIFHIKIEAENTINQLAIVGFVSFGIVTAIPVRLSGTQLNAFIK